MSGRVLGHGLSPLDAAFLYIETDEGPLHIGGVSVLDGDVAAVALAARLEARLSEAPRYMQRVEAPRFGLGHPAWRNASNFDIRHHVLEERLPPPGDEGQLRSCAARLFAQRLDRERPLWEVHVVRGLEGARSAFVWKIHHCMVDGVSGVELMDLTFDTSPDTAAPANPSALTPSPRASAGGLLDGPLRAVTAGLETGAALLRGMAAPEAWRTALHRLVDSTAALTGAATRPVIRLPFNRPLTGRRRLAWTTLPLDEVRVIGRRRGGTINDVALAVLTDAIGRWLTEGGVQIRSRYLRLLVPVNVRRPDERGLLGNRVSMIPVEVPFEGAPLERLERTVAHTTAMKRAGIADLVELATELGDLVPAPLYATALSLAASASLLTWSAAIRSAPFLTANMVCTNVPGPRVPLFVLGRSLVAHYPLVPLAFETGLNCALFTYNQALHVGLVADAGAIDDPDRVIAHLRQAYGDLRTAAAPCDSPVANEGATPMFGPPVSQESHAPAEATVAHPVDDPSTARPKAARRHASHGGRRQGAGKR